MMNVPNNYTRAGLLTAGLLIAGVSASAQDYIWSGAVDATDFTNVGNWLQGGVIPATAPTSTNPTQYNNVTGNIPNYSATGVTQQVNAIYVGVNTAGRLDVSSGILQGTGQNGRYNFGSGGSGNGTVNISGDGTINSGGGTRVGVGGGTGVLNVSGSGSYIAARGLNVGGLNYSIAMGIDNGSNGTTSLTDSATLSTRFGVRLGTGSGSTGVGNLNWTGSDVTLINGTVSGGSFWHSSGSTLGLTVDSSDFSISSMSWGAVTTDAFITIEAGALLDLGFTGAAPTSTVTWTVMDFHDDVVITDGGFGGLAAGWSYAWVDTGGTANANELQLTFTVPEPGTFALIAGALSLMAVMVRRRRA